MFLWLGDAACELGAEYQVLETSASCGLPAQNHLFYGRYLTNVLVDGMPRVSVVDMGVSHKLWMAVHTAPLMDEVQRQLASSSTALLAGICLVYDLDDGVSCAASSMLLQELSWRVPELSLTSIGLLPLGGLQGMANYHAVLSMDASLRLADRFIVRGLDDAMKLQALDKDDTRPFSVGALWRYVAADLMVGAANGLCTTAPGVADSSSATGDWTNRTVSHGCSVMDVRTSMWKRLSLAPVPKGREKKAPKPLRDMSINLQTLHASSPMGRASDVAIAAASILEVRIDAKDRSFTADQRSSSSQTDLKAAFGYATPGVTWPALETRARRARPELHVKSSSASSPVSPASTHRLASSPRGSSSSSSSTSPSVFAATATAATPPDVVGLVFQSPYAIRLLEEVSTKALALIAVGAFLHNVSEDASAAAEEIAMAADQVQGILRGLT